MSHEWKLILSIFYEVSSLALYPIQPTAQLTAKVSFFSHSLYAFMAWCYDILETSLFLSSTVMMVLIIVICAPPWDLPIAKPISCVLSYPQYSLWINETKHPRYSSTWVSKLFTEGLMLHQSQNITLSYWRQVL